MLGKLNRYLSRQSDLVPAKGYDLWAETYDDQPDNLMLALDESIFSGILAGIALDGKDLIDVGCGTGRHWSKFLAARPNSLTGYDVSGGMLERLKEKYPQATTILLNNNRLTSSLDGSCDLLISTLTIAHIENLTEALAEWNRVLRINGDIIITDYHPELLAKGGNRTFRYNGRTVSVKNHIHSIRDILEACHALGWEPQQLTERRIDESVRHYYEQHNALDIFEKYRDTPVIFGMHLKNKYATT